MLLLPQSITINTELQFFFFSQGLIPDNKLCVAAMPHSNGMYLTSLIKLQPDPF